MTEFNIKELFMTIEETEQNVSDLYASLSTKTDGKAKRLFENLSKDELRHKKMFAKFISKLPDDGMVDLEEEDVEYIETLIKTSVFKDRKLKKRMVKEDALVIAEKIEKDGILLKLLTFEILINCCNNRVL
jgi:rubrerythrin